MKEYILKEEKISYEELREQLIKKSIPVGYASFEDIIVWSKSPQDVEAIRASPVIMDIEHYQPCKIYKGLKISVETLQDMHIALK